jgi:hypothetical protein
MRVRIESVALRGFRSMLKYIVCAVMIAIWSPALKETASSLDLFRRI